MKSKKDTLTSIGFGLIALVFAFFLCFSDSKQAGQVVEKIQKAAASAAAPQAKSQPQAQWGQTAFGPETRMEGMPSSPWSNNSGNLSSNLSGNFGAAVSGIRRAEAGAPVASPGPKPTANVEDYLDSAWESPGRSANPMTPQHLPQTHPRGFAPPNGFQAGFPQQGFGNFPAQGGFGHANRGGSGNFPQGGIAGLKKGGFFSADPKGKLEQEAHDRNRLNSARDAVEYELSVVRAQASQAASCLDRAKYSKDVSEQQSAASEARSHAAQARAACARAMSRAAGSPELAGLVSTIRNVASKAEYSAAQAASAASGW